MKLTLALAALASLLTVSTAHAGQVSKTPERLTIERMDKAQQANARVAPCKSVRKSDGASRCGKSISQAKSKKGKAKNKAADYDKAVEKKRLN